ncbi:MAG: chemotaxis protein CheX [Pseudomonadales bacterium]
MYTTSLQSRILVHEHDPTALEAIKSFCEDNQLIGLVDKSASLHDLLKRNINLGAIFISDHSGHLSDEVIDLCVEAHRLRQEVPIFLRTLKEGMTTSNLPLRAHHIFASLYQLDNMAALKELIQHYIFNRQYPNNLVHGIQTISTGAIESMMQGVSISVETPCLVNDHLIYGELSSLIPLESSWCKGHMMIQVEQDGLLQLIRAGKANGACIDEGNINFREINNWLSETTNLIWGPLRTHFLSKGSGQGDISDVQIPIITNQRERYISFGSMTPQLVFKYILSDTDKRLDEVSLIQKFIFNISWMPDVVAGEQISIDKLIGNDDVELF